VARVRQSYVVSAPIAGRLERLPLEVGDPVQAERTLVARIRPATAPFLDPRAKGQAEAALAGAQAGLAQAEADRRRLDAEAQRAAAELTRLSRLAERGYLASQALDNAKAAASAARDAVSGADAVIRARRAEVARARSALAGPDVAATGALAVVSPASGVVTQLLQKSERDVAAGTPLVEIGETRGLEAQIEFLTQDAVKIRPGQRAEIFDWGGPGAIPAEVRRVEPRGYTKISALGVEEQRTLVMLQFTGPPATWAGLAPGYRVWGRVYLRAAPAALLCPTGALVRDKGGWAVFKIEGGRARLRPVTIGAITDQSAEVIRGLNTDDVVVLYPSDQVRDAVRVVFAGRGAAGAP
jgi:HlyD family secretion protein